MKTKMYPLPLGEEIKTANGRYTVKLSSQHPERDPEAITGVIYTDRGTKEFTTWTASGMCKLGSHYNLKVDVMMRLKTLVELLEEYEGYVFHTDAKCQCVNSLELIPVARLRINRSHWVDAENFNKLGQNLEQDDLGKWPDWLKVPQFPVGT